MFFENACATILKLSFLLYNTKTGVNDIILHHSVNAKSSIVTSVLVVELYAKAATLAGLLQRVQCLHWLLLCFKGGCILPLCEGID